jgi:hypothetical protein
MVNAGTQARFQRSVAERLRKLKLNRFNGAPVPIELLVVTDQDDAKSGGLLRLLQDRVEAAQPGDGLAELHGVWANLFASFNFRGNIRRLLARTAIPVNQPFDHLLIREQGPVVHRLPGGLEIAVLGPERENVKALYDRTRRDEDQQNADRADPRSPLAPIITTFPDERFSAANAPPQLQLPETPAQAERGSCRASDNARAAAKADTPDMSVSNVASAILLFRYGGKTFLHTGDSRADLILNALRATRLMRESGSAHVDLLHLPHLGSNHNLTPELLEHLTAENYLFTGDGTYSEPKVESIAMLIAARPCADYTMFFVNRDSSVVTSPPPAPIRRAEAAPRERTHAEKLDVFFAAEEPFRPRYHRIFRATDEGSVIIDLIDRLTY